MANKNCDTEISARLAGLKTGLKFSARLRPDYMENFSPASETNPLKIKLSITWRGIQPGLKILARFGRSGLGFSARAEKQEII